MTTVPADPTVPPAGDGEFALTVVEHAGSLDARRGVVRIAASTLAALGLRPWDPLRVRGNRVTGALVALSPPGSDERTLLADALTLRNLQVASGTTVWVRRAAEQSAAQLVVSAPPEVIAAVPPEVLRTALLGKVVVRGDQVSLLPQDFALPPGTDPGQLSAARRTIEVGVTAWMAVDLLVLDASPAEPAIVTMGTVVGWAGGTSTDGTSTPLVGPVARAADPSTSAAPAAGSTAPLIVPGLEGPAAELREQLDLAFHHSDLLARLGTTPQVGILLTGAAGSGKTTIVESVCAAVGATVVPLRCQRLASLEVNDAVAELTAAAQRTLGKPPAVLYLEDVEQLTPDATGNGGPLLSAVVDTVRSLVADARVAVVATTSAAEAVSPSLRGDGLLQRSITVPLPGRDLRLKMLGFLTRSMPLAADVHLDDVAARTPGYVIADLSSLVHEAAVRAAHRLRGAPTEGTAVVTAADFSAALEVVRPTSMDGQGLEIPDLTLDDVGDMTDVKQVLTEAVLWPLTYPDTFARLGIRPAHGVLLYGPPGCGKTYLVRALAGSGQANVLPVKGAELLSKWVGESERGVRELFRRAREAAPALIFLDEVDALAPQRGQGSDSGVTDRVVAALLTELDGIEALRDVVVVAATNRPDLIDSALLRPGRLDRLVYVPPPDGPARAEILKAAARKTPLEAGIDLAALAERLQGYSAADCAALLREAALVAMRESMAAPLVTAHHLELALATVRPSIKPELLASLEAFAAAHSTS